MANIKEQAQAYQPPQTKNICELDFVSVNEDIKTKTVGEGTEDQFSYDYIVVDETEYRVPKSVLKQLKAHLEAQPNMEAFSVKKSGSGLGTEYTVIPRM